MKPNIRIGSFVLALLVVFAAVAAGCTPISFNKEWAYKTSDNELAIGVYIYSLDLAYSQAQSYAEDQLDDYSTADDDWLDEEITDDDDNTQVAREWIKDQAEKMCLSYLVVDSLIEKYDAGLSTDDTATAESEAEEYWNLGQYASYGYIMPMSDDLEPYGISLDSFTYCYTLYSSKYSQLFTTLYGEGGELEVTDEELTTYFTENYIDYSYVTVNLYESTTDEAGDSTDVALSDDDAKVLTDQFDSYRDKLNDGTSYDEFISEYMSDQGLDSDPSTTSVDNKESTSLGDEVLEAFNELETGKAATLKVGDGDSAVYYLIYKNDINNDVDTYVGDSSNRTSVLSNMKSDDFADYIEQLTGELEYEANTSVLEKYQPELFFVKVEETTAAEETTTADDSSSDS